ncbi:MAG: hypothetical protein KDC67_13130 [Ignavibacteriae bacterium]|nr:hypothetical protein [Ignavibacteriota bacterium]
MRNKDNIILKMGESNKPDWVISTPDNSMYLLIPHGHSMRFMPNEMHMIQSALNKICNGVDIPESKTRLGEAEKQYQRLLNKVAEFHSWQRIVMENWKHFDPIGVYQEDYCFDDPYEYEFYVNPIIDLILQKADFEVLKSYVVDVCENTIGVLPSDELVNDFVSNLVKLQKKITIPRGKHAK